MSSTNESKKPLLKREQGKTILEYVSDGNMMEWFAFSGALGVILAVIFLVYGVLGTDEPKWLGLLMIPLMIYSVYYFAKLMLHLEKAGNDGKELNMFWRFWRMFKQVFWSPLLLVFIYSITLSVLGSQISYLDKDPELVK